MKTMCQLHKVLFKTGALFSSYEKVSFMRTKSPIFLSVENMRSNKQKKLNEVNEVDEIIMEYSEFESPPWEELKEKIQIKGKKMNSGINTEGLLLNSCIKLKLLDFGMSYVEYMFKKGKNLKTPEYVKLILLLTRNNNDITKYEKLVQFIFQNLKSEIVTTPSIQSCSLELFSKFKSCQNELVEMCFKTHLSGVSYVIAAAFDFDDPNTGWKLLNMYPEHISHKFFNSYLLYCIREANENRFTPLFISKLIEFLKDNYCTFTSGDYFSNLETLVSVLNSKKENEYMWSVKETKIHDNMCSECHSKLKKVEIKDEDFQKLKEVCKNNVLKNKLVNLMPDKDIDNFYRFLKTCSKYNVVMDGMNLFLLHRHRQEKMKKLWKILRQRNMEIFVISRKHLAHHIKNELKTEHFQVFFSENFGDDDIFVLCAALEAGKDTYVLSNDYYRKYCPYIPDSRLQRLFKVWTVSHQYTWNLTETLFLAEPFSHGQLSQETLSPDNENGDYCWHLASISDGGGSMFDPNRFNWICLRAVRKTKQKSGIREKRNDKGRKL